MATVTYSWVNRVSPFLVNLFTAGTQTDPLAVSLLDGTYNAFWTTPLDPPITYVDFMNLSSTGGPLTGEGGAGGGFGSQFDAAAVSLTAGQFYVTYTDASSGTNQIKLSNATGIGTGALPVRVDAGILADSDFAIAALSNGGFVVTWTQAFNANDNDLILELYDLNGTALGQHGVDTSATISTFHSSVAGLTGGGFVVAWEQHNKSDGSAPGVWFQRFDNSGGNLSTPHVQVGVADALGGVPADTQVKALHDGGFAVAWTGKSTAGSFNVIDLAIYNADGSVRASGLTADPVVGANHDKPSIAVLSNGDFVVSWTAENDLTSGYQAFDPSGNKLGSAATIDSFVVKDSITSLSGASNGGLVASVFESSNAESAGTGDSIRSSINELVRTTTTTNNFDQVTGDSLRDIIVVNNIGAGLAGGANADTFKFGTFIANGQIPDYDRGNTGSYDATEGDVIDLSALLSTAYAHGSGQAANTLVRVVAGAGQADLQVDTDGAANGTNWVHFETLLSLVVGNTVSVLLDATPGASPVTITVDTPPSFGIITHTSLVVAENSNFSVNQTATDPDPGTTLTYSISGGTDAGAFQLNAQTGALSFVSAHDFEHPTDSDQNNSYLVNVRAFDGAQFTDSFVTVNVTDVNEPPVITSNGGGTAASVSVAENTTAVTTVHATDPDAGNVVSYLIKGGLDAALFNINSSTGVLSFKTAPNFESPADSDHNNSYIVQVSASDGSLASNQTITVNVTDVNDNSPVIDLNGGGATASIPIPENTTAVTTVHATDPDAGTTFAYSIVGGADAGQFAINGSSGALSFITAPDYENPADSDHNNSYIVQVSASDGSLASNQTITVNVANVTEPSKDFNGDLHSDILMQNAATSDVYLWEMNSNSLVGSGPVGWNPGLAWQVKDEGDYNGDGHADVLLQNAGTGDVYMWEMNGMSLVGSGAVGWTPGAAWHATSGGDFNGDGKSDIVLQNANTGDVYLWEMNGTTMVGNGPAGWTPGAAWQVKGTGDFNGDGKSDIVLQNANTGDVYLWDMNGTNLVGGGPAGWTPGAAWQVKATGDYNGDGKSDILLQNVNTGDAYIWELNDTTLVGNGPVGWTPGAAWHATNGGDFNGDGKSDILLQNATTGDAFMWLVNGTSLVGNGPAGWTPGADWHIS